MAALEPQGNIRADLARYRLRDHPALADLGSGSYRHF